MNTYLKLSVGAVCAALAAVTIRRQNADPAMLLEQSECQKILKEAIRGLPLPLREVVVMHYFEDYSVKVLSEILDIPEGTVKYRLFEARKILSRTLGQTFSEDSPLNKKGESET